MKSNTYPFLLVVYSLLLAAICPAQETPCEIAVAALALPGDTNSLLHLRNGAQTSQPLQLSLRYFSERIKLPGHVFQLFQDPLLGKSTPDKTPPPALLTLNIPEDAKLAYVVLWAEQKPNQPLVWRATTFNANDWPRNCLKLLNACPNALGIAAGESHQTLLPKTKSMNFPAKDWEASFPVKVYQIDPKPKLVFSSTWRVSTGQRELCVLFKSGEGIALRAVMERDLKPPTAL